ncbi:PIG-L family deacetylase [Streptomyces stramineus]
MNTTQRMVISRRTALTGLAATTVAVAAGCSGGGGPDKPKASPSSIRAVDPRATQSFNNAKGSLLLQVMAHPDDDLYFMNPDAEHIVRAGVPVVSVYVTAGEAVGQNWVEGMPPRASPTRPPTPRPGTRGCARPTRRCWAWTASRPGRSPSWTSGTG